MWKCSKCNESVDNEFDSCWNCGTNKDGSPAENQSEFNATKSDVIETIKSAQQNSPTVSGSFAIAGVLLIIFGVIQWNTGESKLRRSFGQTDVLAVLLFLGGAIAFIKSFSHGSTTSPSSSDSARLADRSIENRLRELDNLHTKQLISDAEYEQRRKDIIAML